MTSNAAEAIQIPQRVGPELKPALRFVDIVEKRALGLRRYHFIHDDLVAYKLYSNFYQYEISRLEKVPQVGGVFNLEFSLDG